MTSTKFSIAIDSHWSGTWFHVFNDQNPDFSMPQYAWTHAHAGTLIATAAGTDLPALITGRKAPVSDIRTDERHVLTDVTVGPRCHQILISLCAWRLAAELHVTVGGNLPHSKQHWATMSAHAWKERNMENCKLMKHEFSYIFSIFVNRMYMYVRVHV